MGRGRRPRRWTRHARASPWRRGPGMVARMGASSLQACSHGPRESLSSRKLRTNVCMGPGRGERKAGAGPRGGAGRGRGTPPDVRQGSGSSGAGSPGALERPSPFASPRPMVRLLVFLALAASGLGAAWWLGEAPHRSDAVQAAERQAPSARPGAATLASLGRKEARRAAGAPVATSGPFAEFEGRPAAEIDDDGLAELLAALRCDEVRMNATRAASTLSWHVRDGGAARRIAALATPLLRSDDRQQRIMVTALCMHIATVEAEAGRPSRPPARCDRGGHALARGSWERTPTPSTSRRATRPTSGGPGASARPSSPTSARTCASSCSVQSPPTSSRTRPASRPPGS